MTTLVNSPLGNPYPLVGKVMDLARVRVNDAMNDIDGDLLTNDAPYTQTMLNSAWRWLQGQAYTKGVETFIKELIISAFPARGSNDSADQAFIGWMGAGDGLYQYAQPALPQDLIQPLSMWRRQSEYTNAVFCLMTQATDGLPVFLDPNVYDWRDDGLYFFGAHYAQDFRIRYAAYRPDLVIADTTALVPMMMCEDCLSARIAFEYANLRGAPEAAGLAAMADAAFATIAQRTSRRKQRQTLRRIPYSRRSSQYNRFPFISN